MRIGTRLYGIGVLVAAGFGVIGVGVERAELRTRELVEANRSADVLVHEVAGFAALAIGHHDASPARVRAELTHRRRALDAAVDELKRFDLATPESLEALATHRGRLDAAFERLAVRVGDRAGADGVDEVLLERLLAGQIDVHAELLADTAFAIAEESRARIASAQLRLSRGVRHVSLATALIVTVLLVLMARNLVPRLVRLERAAVRVGAGDFGVRVDMRGTDAIAQVGHAFDRMVAEVDRETAARREAEGRMRLLLDSVAEGIYGLDAELRVTFVNDAALEMLGYAREEVVGRAMHALVHHSYADGTPYPESECPVRRVVVEGSVQHVDCEVLWRRDGTPLEAEYTSAPICGEDGATIGAVVVFRDVGTLRRSERRLRAVLDKLPLGVAIYDADERFAACNESFRETHAEAGIDHLLVPGTPYETVLRAAAETYAAGGHVVDVDAFVDDRLAFRREGGARTLERRRPDGGTHIVREARTDEGETVATYVDVTDLHRREAALGETMLALEATNADLEEFTHVASHDLRAPLQGIANLAEWIAEALGEDADEQVIRDLARLRLRVRRLERLIQDLLAYSRAGRGSTEPEPIDIADMVRGIALDLEPGPGFRIEAGADPVTLVTCRTPFETVLRNLVSNAINHHDRDAGCVCVTARREDGTVHVRVRDDGPGVPDAVRDRIFRPFQRGSSTSRWEGTGIGLAIASKTVQRYGGVLSLGAPEGERGAVFEFTWPACEYEEVRREDAA